MEGRAFVSEAFLASSEGAEVLGGLRYCLSIEAHDNATKRLLSMLNVEVNLMGDLGSLGGFGSLGEENKAEPEEQGGRDG